MANHPSALKRDRQSKARRSANRDAFSHLKTFVRAVRENVAGHRLQEAADALKEATSALDHAVSNGIIHRNTASRKVSRLTHLVRASASAEAQAKPKS